MTLDKTPSETGLNLREPKYAGWREVDANSARNFRNEIHREERELLRRNQEEHEELRMRVAKLEYNESAHKPVIDAASKMVAASHAVKAVIVIVAIIFSVVTGAIQIFDKWAQK